MALVATAPGHGGVTSPVVRTVAGSMQLDLTLTAARCLEVRVLSERDERHLREGREPIDRPMWIGDPPDLGDRGVDGGGDVSVERLGRAGDPDRLESIAPSLAEVLDVGPLVVDLLGALRQVGVCGEGTVEDGVDGPISGGVHERQRTLGGAVRGATPAGQRANVVRPPSLLPRGHRPASRCDRAAIGVRPFCSM